MGEPDDVGLPLHFVDVTHDGLKVARSFGDAKGEFIPGRSSQIALSWELSPAADGGFWSQDVLRYRIRKWSADGRLQLVLERSPTWFGPQESMSIGTPEQPPRAVSKGLSEADGLVWSVVHVPGPDWKNAWPKGAPLSGELQGGAINVLKLYETRVEAIDPRTHRVIGRVELPENTLAVLPGAKIVTYTEDSNGFPILTVLTLSIKR
jgi:hypothetical protein